MTTLPTRLLRIVATSLITLLLSAGALAGEVSVAVASNFNTTLRQLASSFEAQSGHTLRISSASTGKLYAQISHGAPYDLFLAADAARPARLVEEGKAVRGSLSTYALGKLVFWSPKSASDGDAIALLQSGTFKRLALANPKTAPYGLAAQSTLEKLALWQPPRHKHIRGENVGQTFQFISSGAVDGGFIALALTQTAQRDGLIWQVPDDYYAPIKQQVVLLKRAAEHQPALSFLSFLSSDVAQAIIHKSGYAIAEGE